jgi:hypothetical protein
MGSCAFRAGTLSELERPVGEWVFVDIGFARASKTCGYLLASANARNDVGAGCAVSYGELTKRLIEVARRPDGPVHIVLEAPLSAAFGGDGNPLGRAVEKRESKTRYWYVGLGCQVLVASLYLMKAILDATPAREIRLFEGLVSFKDGSAPSNHCADVEALRAVIWSGGRGGRFVEPEALACKGESRCGSTLALLGIDIEPPPIIEVVAG